LTAMTWHLKIFTTVHLVQARLTFNETGSGL
jgi:hypothetical protein